MSNLGPRWTGSYHVKEGFQVSIGKMEGKQKKIRKGSKKQGVASPSEVVANMSDTRETRDTWGGQAKQVTLIPSDWQLFLAYF